MWPECAKPTLGDARAALLTILLWLVVFDLWAVLTGGETISSVFWDWRDRWPYIRVVLGGAFFWLWWHLSWGGT